MEESLWGLKGAKIGFQWGRGPGWRRQSAQASGSVATVPGYCTFLTWWFSNALIDCDWHLSCVPRSDPSDIFTSLSWPLSDTFCVTQNSLAVELWVHSSVMTSTQAGSSTMTHTFLSGDASNDSQLTSAFCPFLAFLAYPIVTSVFSATLIALAFTEKLFICVCLKLQSSHTETDEKK